ncbi:hypothetical protein OUZ56_009511 [Daphnia magna]|uniref:Uncharacterized protein n=1 Tax=Daphnia magna TaxID=35525 RepID=A0ABR0AG72_9CRUS|nr:hypothetical protein OUZ56_009511 [Daphnia magna]
MATIESDAETFDVFDGLVEYMNIEHLKTVHKIDPGCKRVPKKGNGSANERNGRKSMLDVELDGLCVMWLCHVFLPFRTGESKYFQKFIAALKPDYVIPSRTKLSQCLVPELANEIQEKLITILQQRDVADVVLTTDAWASCLETTVKP